MATIVQLSGMLARDAQFRTWIASLDGGEELDPEQCAEFIRLVCCVESRRELATSKEAAERFHNFIRKPFVQWRERQAEHA